jgi:hypothetical protein
MLKMRFEHPVSCHESLFRLTELVDGLRGKFEVVPHGAGRHDESAHGVGESEHTTVRFERRRGGRFRDAGVAFHDALLRYALTA